MKTYKGNLELYSEQGIGQICVVIDNDPSLKNISIWERTFTFKKNKEYFVKILKEESVLYEGKWTYSRRNTSINMIDSPNEISAKEWKKMIQKKSYIFIEDKEDELDTEKFIIKSLLDNDLYKLTMMQYAYNQKKEKQWATYSLKVRDNTNLNNIKEELEQQIKYLKTLRFKEEEIKYLESLEVDGVKIFKKEFLTYLRYFNLSGVFFKVENKDNLELRFSGTWEASIFLEVPLMAIISELNFKNKYSDEDGYSILEEKINFFKEKELSSGFVDMGTRRRVSFDWHKKVVKKLSEKLKDNFKGTSNILLAKELSVTPIGTMAHEFFQAFQSLGTSLETSQKEALYAWKKEYPTILSVALTDIFGTDVFLNDCDKDLTLKYKGFRHDSGDPISWGYRMLAHFHEMGIDASKKTLVFSDGLNFEKMFLIEKEFKGKTNLLFGIGTYLTNDFKNHKAISMVIKLVEMNGVKTIKVSDEMGKITCEDESLIKYTLDWISRVKRYPVIKVATDIVLLNEKKEILMIERGDKKEAGYSLLALPGGYLDYFENSKEGVVRELFEELGVKLNPKDVNFVKIMDEIDRDPRGRTISLVFKSKINKDTSININKKEVKKYKWISMNNLEKEKVAFDHYKILKEVLND